MGCTQTKQEAVAEPSKVKSRSKNKASPEEVAVDLPKTAGLPTIHMVWRVPADREEEIDAYWKEHEAWMNKTHRMGSDGDDSVGPRLVEFYISKGQEMTNPMDPEEGTTGNLIYEMSECYYAAEGIAKHMELGQSQMPEWFAKLAPYGEEFGVHMDVGSQTVLTCFADDGSVFNTPTGSPNIHMYWRVPADKEEEIDAFWREHEAWMRESHTMGPDGDDSEGPRLLAFYISKGQEMTNPMDPEEGTTGNLIYNMSETYVAPEGIAKHMELGQSQMPEWFEKFNGYAAEYTVHMDVGSQSVFTNMACCQPTKTVMIDNTDDGEDAQGGGDANRHAHGLGMQIDENRRVLVVADDGQAKSGGVEVGDLITKVGETSFYEGGDDKAVVALLTEAKNAGENIAIEFNGSK